VPPDHLKIILAVFFGVFYPSILHQLNKQPVIFGLFVLANSVGVRTYADTRPAVLDLTKQANQWKMITQGAIS
jgi:hypothetical protein